MQIELVYALPHEQDIMTFEVEQHCNVAQAVRQSGILQRYSELSMETLQVGIFGKQTDLLQPLRAGDRVEIYRPLTIDPKDARRLRAKT